MILQHAGEDTRKGGFLIHAQMGSSYSLSLPDQTQVEQRETRPNKVLI